MPNESDPILNGMLIEDSIDADWVFGVSNGGAGFAVLMINKAMAREAALDLRKQRLRERFI